MKDRPVRAWLADARYYAAEAARIRRTLNDAASGRDYLAIRYCLVVVGEALNEVPAHVLAEMPSVPWRQIIALRHRLVHGYWLIDHDIVMNIAQDQTEDLVAALSQLIETFER